MASNTRRYPSNITFDTTVVEVRYDGIPLGLPTYLSNALAKLIRHHRLHWSQIHPNDFTARVYISQIRKAMEDCGFPMKITNRIGKRSEGFYSLEFIEHGDSWWEQAENGG